LEKTTAVGVASLRPVLCHRSVASGGGVERCSGRCISAAKQCGLNWLPKIHEPTPLADFLASLDECESSESKATFILGDLSDRAKSLAEILTSSDPPDKIFLLVGPEGGVTGEEREAIIAGGFIPARLGETTLRIETAAVALLGGVRAML
jgi:16S rRNA (uracil1498-N3)-methyltransferase